MCLNPQRVIISNRFQRYTMDVPCQKCIICLKNQQNQWIPRIYYELKECKCASFLTLTYNNRAVPRVFDKDTGEEFKSLKKQDFQLVLKRFRQHYCRERGISKVDWKYFMCGEYGPTTLRPHYHVIFFGLKPDDLSFFISEWQKDFGYVHSQQIKLTHKSLYNISAYVAKYAVKGLFENPKAQLIPTQTDNPLCPIIKLPNICVKSFRLLSKGLGKSYLEPNTISYHLATDYLSTNSDEQSDEIICRKFHEFAYTKPSGETSYFKIPLCRYYQRYIFGENNFLTDSNLRALRRRNEQVYLEELESLPAALSLDEKFDLLHSNRDFKEQQVAQSIFEKLQRKYLKSKV